MSSNESAGVGPRALSLSSQVKAGLDAYGLRPKKDYGQNFLTDKNVINALISAIDPNPRDTVIEIGPGLGALTLPLAERAGRLVCVEADHALIPPLTAALAGFSNVRLVRGDFLKQDIASLAAGPDNEAPSGPAGPVKVAGCLPYYITSPLIYHTLNSAAMLHSLVFMMQKEVALKLTSSPGGKDYGVLALTAAYHANAEIMAHIPPSAFYPQPGVDSAIVRLTIHDTPPAQTDKTFLFTVIKAAFATRRKTLLNCLLAARLPGMTREALSEAIARAGLPADARGETLSLADFDKLAGFI